MSNSSLPAEVEYLFDTDTIRHRCEIIKQLASNNKLKYWQLYQDKLPFAANYVLNVIRQNYPDLNVPYHSRWRHIDCSGYSRVNNLAQQIDGDKQDKARALFEMTLVSVLLDAGAGMQWRYNEHETDKEYSKSEGLAVAAYHQYCRGGFSHIAHTPFLVSALGLQQTTEDTLKHAFQVTDTNPLVGVSGRVKLLQSLGHTINARSHGFAQGQRLAELFDCIASQAHKNCIPAKTILRQLLISLGSIWPQRLVLDSYNLGDTWDHYALESEAKVAGKIPFHKLSQWLAYSLLEPIQYFFQPVLRAKRERPSSHTVNWC